MYNYASPVYIKLSNICTIVVCNNTEQRKIRFSRERDEKLKTVSSFIMIAIIIYVTKGGKIFFEIIKKNCSYVITRNFTKYFVLVDSIILKLCHFYQI